MSDASTTTTPPPVVTPPAPQPNTPEARTPTGELRDQTQPLASTTTTTPPPTTTTETPPATPPVVPEAYKPFTVPEGFSLNKDAVDAAVPVFKELGLTQDQAQKLVDLQSKREAELAKSGQGDYAAMRKDWRDKVLANPELSAGGKIKPEVTQTIGRAIDGINNPKLAAEFRQVMDTTGVGDNPAFVEAFFAMAKQLTEGRPVQGVGPSPGGQTAPDAKPKSIANAMYPNLK
jgi:hypothetical protein